MLTIASKNDAPYVTASLEMLYVILDQWTNSEGISIVNVSKFNSPLIIIDEIGGGRGFSLLAESILNFGYIGIPMVFSILGVFFWLY